MREIQKEILSALLESQQLYIVVQTEFTEHHIERLSKNSDRGHIKWIAETRLIAWDKMKNSPEARRSHIDGADMFPRLYFNNDCFITEFFSWLAIRDLTITDIKTPKI
jgi:predicted class III extradiol MEMO1 family dioxygenase